MVERAKPALPISQQCRLLALPRSSVYRKPAEVSAGDLAVMPLIDRQYLVRPYYGSRRMAAWLATQGHAVNRNRAFEALGVTEARRAADPDTQATMGFKAITREAADTRSYAAALSVLVVAEWLYLNWASRAPQPLPNNFVHAEWITLHDNPGFREFVDFLRAELDRVGPAQADLCRDFFYRAVGLELSFFEAAYTT